MPRMNKGGKFIFGKSLIKEDGTLQFPEQAIQEYDIMSEGKIYDNVKHETATNN